MKGFTFMRVLKLAVLWSAVLIFILELSGIESSQPTGIVAGVFVGALYLFVIIKIIRWFSRS